MQGKFRYALPIVQMALAAGLLRWSDIWLRAALRVNDMPGPAPALQLLVAINAPVSVARAFWFRYLPGYWDHVSLILAIGLFWYWIALSIRSWREGRTIVIFTWSPLRVAADLLLIAAGGFFAFYFVHYTIYEFGIVRRPWYFPIVISYALWSFSLIFFPGHDLFQCVFLRRHRAANYVQS
jgi:hypothetical protein